MRSNNTTGEHGCRTSLDRHWGWVVAVASFFIYFVCCGTLGTFVLLFVYFEREFQSTAMAVGWIGSLSNGLLNLMSFVSSPLYEKFTRRLVIAIGVLLCSAGILATSFTTSVWQVYITFGIVFAVGLNFTSNPSLNLMTLYFPGRNCVRATAFASAGQAVGTLTMTPILEAVLSVIGWRSALQYLSVAILVTCLPLAAVFKLPPQQCSTRLHDHDLPSEANQTLEVVNLSRDEKCYKEKATSPKQSASAEGEELVLEQNTGIYSNKENQEEETSTFLEVQEAPEQQVEIIPPLPTNEKSRPEAGEEETPFKNDVDAKNGTSSWGKYIALGKDHRHSCFFIGILGATVSIYFNGINLVSCMTAGGIPERTAAWLITVFNVADLSSRVVLCFVGDHLPIGRITVLMVTAAIGAISSFLLTLGVSLPIFIVYCIIAGFVRGVFFGIAVACVVELFGAHKTVETLTSLQIAYGIGGLLASSVAGLSYDVTGTYKTSHYTCSVLWAIASVMFGIMFGIVCKLK
ncbi:monocarboxylate transporter 7-like isoform X2 [Asterias amurensis]|uniref:monocarboxylate transporter 7-like isoform X2 n=1 Tax=Asterias amurensis TaxID=7602 RepID=UPI003AB15EAA